MNALCSFPIVDASGYMISPVELPALLATGAATVAVLGAVVLIAMFVAVQFLVNRPSPRHVFMLDLWNEVLAEDQPAITTMVVEPPPTSKRAA